MANERQSLDDLRIDEIVKSISNYAKLTNGELDKNLVRFLKLFNKEFPKSDSATRARAEVLTWALLQGTIFLYAIDNNQSVIIELHSILEKISIRDFPKFITSDKQHQNILRNIIERKNLIDIAPFYKDLGVWSENDLAIVTKLSKIRNGIAHLNEKLISKSLNSGKEMHFLDIDSVAKKHKTHELIISVIKLLLKISSGVRASEDIIDLT
jgi:hypothetical protein